MLRRRFLTSAAAAAALPASLSAQASITGRPSGGVLADVNGERMFYSVTGAGKPLVLVHGGINPDSYGTNLGVLARSRQIIAVHLQGHGHTPDTDRPLRIETLADDVAGLIRHLELGKADLMGYSLGAGVALQAAIRHPDWVDRLVLVSPMMKRDAAYPEGIAAFDQLESNADTFGPGVASSPLGQAYPEVDWTNLFRKVGGLTKRPYNWSADVAAMRTRTMLVFADADMMKPEHMVEFWKALGADSATPESTAPCGRSAASRSFQAPPTTPFRSTRCYRRLSIAFSFQSEGCAVIDGEAVGPTGSRARNGPGALPMTIATS